MTEMFYQNIIHHLKTAYAYHRIICSDDGMAHDYEFIEVNAEFERLMGINGADIAGKMVSEVFPGVVTDRFDWIGIYGDVALNGSEMDFEQYSESLNRHYRVKVYSPRKFHFITLFNEITIGRKSLESIMADQESFEMFFESDPEVVLTIRLMDEMIINASRPFTGSLGYSRYELIGKSCLALGLFANPVQYREIKAELLSSGTFISKDIVFHRKDGSEYAGLMSGKSINIGNDSYIYNSIQSLTDRKKVEDVLVASELRYRRLFESAQDGILILDAATGHIIDVNQFLIDLLDYSKEQFLNKSIWDIGFFSDIVDSMEKYLELLKKEYIRYEDLPLRTAGGRSIHVEFVSNVYVEEGMKVIQCNIRDITERFKAKEALDISERKYENYIENAPGGVFIVDENGNYIEVNKAASKMTGYRVEQLLKMTIRDITAEESMENAGVLFETLKEQGKMSGDFQFMHKSGLKRWCSIDAVKLSEKRFLGFSNDITDKKKSEELSLFLGYHDQLTGLHNRRYFENAIVGIDTDKNLPISLVICDINGLKITNDSFGHAVGDALLLHTAKILRELANPDEIVARIGGDEFTLVCPRMDSSAVRKKINDIRSKIANVEVSGIHLSLSFGYETKTSSQQTFMETFANAENHMYRHKLFEESSLRGKTIDIIMQTLFEKSDRELQHSKRVSEICQAIASSMRFDKDGVDRIRTAGLVHDIGKIGINESILNKTSSLDDLEWFEIKKHPEIGWRILSAANDFFDLANYVLNHHERWDGHGYPNGIRQEEIPIEARIIALADAFDAMSSKRSYREGMSEEQAVSEIMRCSGSHFDPGIVGVFLNQVLPSKCF